MARRNEGQKIGRNWIAVTSSLLAGSRGTPGGREPKFCTDRRIAEFARWAKETEDARRLTTIPRIGVTIATALIAAVGKIEHARGLAAWLGLVPRQSSTGGQPKLMGISKRGNKYLRTLLIHGARAALPRLAGC
jgi:transposase